MIGFELNHGIFKTIQNVLAVHVQNAMCLLMKTMQENHSTIQTKLKPFDFDVGIILNYGCEILGNVKGPDTKAVQHIFKNYPLMLRDRHIL